ncbi:hypothetical protein BKI52_07665 [marine bacterium AO1-C]|nr:hypothetical protein BKI52_07665 [marine bacterium AO1-C]
MNTFYEQLSQRNWLLTRAGEVFLLLFAVFFIAYWLDGRKIMGINPWIKPMKFALSIWIFLWTMSWLLAELPQVPRITRIISIGITICMLIEIGAIALQAARGTTSHFNISTSFDTTVFSIMGVMIAINTLLMFWVLGLFFMQKTNLNPAYLWGIRLGLIIFLLASAEGGFMASRGAHSVGVADRETGLPFLNWSVLGGDLRIAHFIGLHALQIIPLAAWILIRKQPQQAITYTIIFAVLYAIVSFGLFGMAMMGKPLLSKL